jgi:hypothetical protein
LAGAAQTLGSILGSRLRLGDLGQVYIDPLVWDAVEQMTDEIQPRARLSSAGTMCQGAHGVWVALIMRW